MKKVYYKPELDVVEFDTDVLCALRVAGEASAADNMTVYDGAWAGFTE